MVEALSFIFNMVYGPSLVTMSPSGKGAMHQISGCMPLALSFDCQAYSCQFPGQNVPPMTIGQKVAIFVAGIAFFTLLLVAVLAIFVRRYKLKQRFLNMGERMLPVTLSWQNVSCSLDLGRGQYLQTLQSVSGRAYAGTVLALLGESGAGKTSLLDTLAGRKTFGVLHGSIMVNGRPRASDWRRVSGYCMQDDMFVPTLTVRECVLFSARMRLPALMNDAEREMRVTEALEAMGLLGVEKSLVGDYARKGISGGERKRLAIACELVTNPSCLFLDEPTSGLDSANALRVVKCLHALAHNKGINVVFSIHQPDSAIFSFFDNVHVLAKGRLVYSGPGKKLISFFEPLGYHCPANYNPADFVIHTITSIQDTDQLDQIALHNAKVALAPERGAAAAADGRSDLVEADPALNINWDAKKTPGGGGGATLTGEGDQEEELLLLERSKEIGEHAQSWLMQFLYLARRSLVATWRSNLILTQYVMVLLCGLLLGTLFFNLSLSTTGVQNRTGVIQFVVILLTFLSLTSIDTFVSNRQLYLREKSSGYFSSSAYFVSLVLTDVIFLRLIPPILLSSVMYWMCGLHAGITHFLWFTGLLVFTSFTGVAICLLISVVTPTVAMGNLVGILILLFSILFEGILINQSTIPGWMVFIKYTSFVNYAFEALMINEFADLTLMANVPGSSTPVPVNGAYFLVEIGLNPNNFYFDLYVLVAMGLVLFVAAFVLLTSVKEQR